MNDKTKPQPIKTVGDLRRFLEGIPDTHEVLFDDLNLEQFFDVTARLSNPEGAVIFQDL
jgi:hypothetical protein